MECNCCPERLNTSLPSGAASQLASQLADTPQYDGVTIEQMQNNPLYNRIDDIDKVGIARHTIKENAKTLKSNEKKIRAVNELGEKLQKPAQK